MLKFATIWKNMNRVFQPAISYWNESAKGFPFMEWRVSGNPKIRPRPIVLFKQWIVAKLRVYTISDQDNSGPWLRKEFPKLFYITSPGSNDGGAYHHATWSGISGDFFHGRFVGADFSLVTNEWLNENVRKKGPLGQEYPNWEFLMEGDTPSLLNQGVESWHLAPATSS